MTDVEALKREWLGSAARRTELQQQARAHGDGTQEHTRLMRRDREICHRLLTKVGPMLKAAGVDPYTLKPQMELFEVAS
jgi:hypothetical protein